MTSISTRQDASPTRRRCKYTLMMITIYVVMSIVFISGIHFRFGNGIIFNTEDPFQQRTSDKDLRMLRTLLETFDELASRVNLTYFIGYGSLVGSVRHHEIIPWDDDIDVAVFEADKHKLQLLKVLLPDNMDLYTRWFKRCWKLYYKGRDRIRFNCPWSYPFLDIEFLVRENGQIWHTIKKNPSISMDVTCIFPLIRRPFLGMQVPVPRLTEKYLTLSTGSDVMKTCVSSEYNHSLEWHTNPFARSTVPCQTLWQRFPFVHRQRIPTVEDPNLVNETLVVNGTIQYSVITHF